MNNSKNKLNSIKNKLNSKKKKKICIFQPMPNKPYKSYNYKLNNIYIWLSYKYAWYISTT